MKKTKKVITFILCAVMLMSVSIFSTLAYLTAGDEVENTFTVGDIKLLLDEAKVDEYGNLVYGADRVKANDYHLVPNRTYVKDPTVQVLKDSEDCYVRMLVTINKKAEIDSLFGGKADEVLLGMFGGLDIAKWVPGDSESDETTRTYAFYWPTAVERNKTEDQPLDPLFETIKVPAELTNEQLALLEGFKMDVQAQAIQAEGFDDYTAAWEAFEGIPVETEETEETAETVETEETAETEETEETEETAETEEEPLLAYYVIYKTEDEMELNRELQPSVAYGTLVKVEAPEEYEGRMIVDNPEQEVIIEVENQEIIFVYGEEQEPIPS